MVVLFEVLCVGGVEFQVFGNYGMMQFGMVEVLCDSGLIVFDELGDDGVLMVFKIE